MATEEGDQKKPPASETPTLAEAGLPLTGGVVGVAVGRGAWVAAGWVGGAGVAGTGVGVVVAVAVAVAIAVGDAWVAVADGVPPAATGVRPTWLRGVEVAVRTTVAPGVPVASVSFELPPQEAETARSRPIAMSG